MSSDAVLLIRSADLKAVQAYAERAYPYECCGVLLGHRDGAGAASLSAVVEVTPLINAWTPGLADWLAPEFVAFGPSLGQRSSTQAERYWIDPQDLLRQQRRARDRGLIILGIYHSHPDHPAEPSECDRVMAWTDYVYVIVAVNQGVAMDTSCWQLDSNHQFQRIRMGEPSPSLMYSFFQS